MEGNSIKAQKIQAMKNYKRRAQFLYNLILYSLTSLITCFFFYHPLCSPSLKHLLFSLPSINIFSYLSNPISLFVIANIIIFILIGESKLARGSSPAKDIYDEYTARSQSRRYHKVINNHPDIVRKEKEEEKKKEMRICRSMSHRHHHKEKKQGMMRVSKSEVWGESEIVKIEKEQQGQIICVPNDEELNKRVEDFIARVNKQRLLEAKLLALDHRSPS